MRQNKMAIKVKATGNGSDPEQADVRAAIIKHIEDTSKAEDAYDNATLYQVTAGYGCWRVSTVYTDDEGFDQDIRIEPIENPWTVYFDPNAKEYDCSDGMFALVTVRMSRGDFKAKYPGIEPANFSNTVQGDRDEWVGADFVRIGEYWRKEPYTKTLLLLSDGRTVEDDDNFRAVADQLAQGGMDPQTGQPIQPVTVVRQRQVECHKVYCYTIAGSEIIDAKEWAGKYIPLVPLWGKVVNIEGRKKYRGLVRFAKDPQRVYNYARSALIERVALAPKSPWLLTTKMIAEPTIKALWDKANVESRPYLVYEPDERMPGGMPNRQQGADVPVGLVQQTEQSAEEIRATMNLFEANLGAPSNETSGKAIFLRQRKGELSTFIFTDNLAKSIKYTGQIVLDLIPKIYDTQRIFRIMGEDGEEDFIEVNKPIFNGQQWITLNDLNVGKYDVKVESGPSYATRRLETAEALTNIVSQAPELRLLLADKIVGNLDIPGGDDVLKRIQRFQAMQGLIDPPEDVQMPTPPQPNPMDIAKLRETDAKTAKYQADATKSQSDAMLNMAQIGVHPVMYNPNMPPPPVGAPDPSLMPPPGGLGQ